MAACLAVPFPSPPFLGCRSRKAFAAYCEEETGRESITEEATVLPGRPTAAKGGRAKKNLVWKKPEWVGGAARLSLR